MATTKSQYTAKISTKRNPSFTKTSMCIVKYRKQLDKLPCASILVRVREAPKEGFKVLRKEDFPQKLWDKMGLWPFPKPYSSGSFCNKECRVNEAELKLFDSIAKDAQRAAKVERPVAEEAITFARKIEK